MLKLDASYWNSRYQANDSGWDIGAVSTPLKAYIDQLTNKQLSVLIPGAGNAYEAEYLHHNGFQNVHLVDYATEALDNFNKRVPDFPAQNLHAENFFEHSGQYDLIIEQTFFCAIDPSLRARYASTMNSLLKPGGKLVGLLFNDKLNADRPPFGGSREEYIAYFEPYFGFTVFETAYNSITPRAGRELFINLRKKSL